MSMQAENFDQQAENEKGARMFFYVMSWFFFLFVHTLCQP